MKTVLSLSARREIAEAYALIELRAGRAGAERFLVSLDRLFQLLEIFPNLGSLRPARREGVPEVRMMRLRHHPFIVFYSVRPGHVRVERVLRVGAALVTLRTPPDGE